MKRRRFDGRQGFSYKLFVTCTRPRKPLLQLAQTADGGANGGGVGGSQGVGATSDGLIAGGTAPDADGTALEGELTAEAAEVLGVLGNDELLGALTGVGTVAGTALAHDAHLDGTLGHVN